MEELPNLLYQVPQPFGSHCFDLGGRLSVIGVPLGVPAQHEKAKNHHKVNNRRDTKLKASSPDDLSGSTDVQWCVLIDQESKTRNNKLTPTCTPDLDGFKSSWGEHSRAPV